MFELPAERTPDRLGLIARWVPRIAVSLAFLGLGPQKFTDRFWIQTFQEIGLGDWLRYLTGSMQIAGAVLLLIPRTAFVGTLLLGTTMVGAMLAWIFFLGSPASALFPGILLGIIVAIAINARSTTVG
jgi:hypothetical protein